GIATLTFNMFLPSLVNIAETFGVSYAVVSISMAGYLAVTAVLQIVIGPLSDRYGRRPVILVAVAIFVAASVGCLVAQDIWVFLICRMVQGTIIASSAVARVIVRDMHPAGAAVRKLGTIAMAMAVAPMLAPMLGGALDEAFGWRASFVAFTVLGIFALTLAWVDLGETNAHPSETLGRQMRAYPVLLRSGPFWGYALCSAFSTGAFFTFIAGVPLVASASFGVSTGALGVWMGTITGGYIFGSFCASRLGGSYGLAMMMLAGRLTSMVGLSLGLALMGLGFVHEWVFFGATLFVGIGNGITTPSANVGSMSVRADLGGTASGMTGALTVGVSAVLTWATGAVVSVHDGPMVLTGLILAVVLVSLLCAVWVSRFAPERVVPG
ncbi:MAG: multidrug effflux MFS transporter, partial [Pseudomonadota bacterium]